MHRETEIPKKVKKHENIFYFQNPGHTNSGSSQLVMMLEEKLLQINVQLEKPY